MSRILNAFCIFLADHHIPSKPISRAGTLLAVFIFVIFITVACSPDDSVIVLDVQVSENAATQVPVSAAVTLPEDFRNQKLNEIGVTLATRDGSFSDIPGQIIHAEDSSYQLWWVLPHITSGTSTWEATLHPITDATTPDFMWHDTPGKHLDLIYDNKKVFRYEYEMDSVLRTGETLTAHNRVFYHIFNLAGDRLITNGPEAKVWPHHRGIMIGWRDVYHDGRKMSFWGMEQLTTQEHVRFLELSAGPVRAKVQSLIHWNDSTGKTILEEIRTAVIYHRPPPAIALVDFTSELKAVNGDVRLEGDAEHGGVQFRAHDDIAAEAPGSSRPMYFFHKDGIDPKTDYNLPWVGMFYGLDNRTYSVIEMAGEGVPQPAIWSAYRDYGRFGPYFKKELANGEAFEVHFRFIINEGSMPGRDEINGQYELYRNPVKVSAE